MFNKLKSALYNVVGSFDPTDGGTVGNLGTASLASGVGSIHSIARQNSNQGKEKIAKFPYTRPHFLQLNSEDEILVTADHALRPIICPRDISRIPWNAGYAETINAGKSKKNEDQAAVHVGLLTRCVNHTTSSAETNSNLKRQYNHSAVNGYVQPKTQILEEPLKQINDRTVNQEEKTKPASGIDLHQNGDSSSSRRNENHEFVVSLPYYYFGVFDGHAGWGAAVSAANQLQHIIHEKLCDAIDLIIPDVVPDDCNSNLCGPLWCMERTVTPESAVIGALEQAFWTMDQQIADDRLKHYLSGGCTACVALFILGKLFVANAGDSRGTIGHNSVPVPMSFDFTPETETQRIRKLGARHPELLGGEFTHLEFLRRPLKRDVGKKAAFRDHYMKGWGLKTITEADLKYPLVCGEGKRSRVLATIGVTRGFGDHDLKAQFSALPIKPFLLPEPEVRVFDLTKNVVTEKDILILGTDGLWDITSNDKAVSIVCNSLLQFPPEDSHKYKYRYTSAAHDLVLWSRGRLKEHNWRTGEDKHATIDDISVFVIPLKSYQEEYKEWQQEALVASSEVYVSSPEEPVALSEIIMMPSENKTPSALENPGLNLVNCSEVTLAPQTVINSLNSQKADIEKDDVPFMVSNNEDSMLQCDKTTSQLQTLQSDSDVLPSINESGLPTPVDSECNVVLSVSNVRKASVKDDLACENNAVIIDRSDMANVDNNFESLTTTNMVATSDLVVNRSSLNNSDNNCPNSNINCTPNNVQDPLDGAVSVISVDQNFEDCDTEVNNYS